MECILVVGIEAGRSNDARARRVRFVIREEYIGAGIRVEVAAPDAVVEREILEYVSRGIACNQALIILAWGAGTY